MGVLKEIEMNRSTLQMLARIGVQDSEVQTTLRQKFEGALRKDLLALDSLLGSSSNHVLDGQVFGKTDAEVFAAISTLWMFLLKPADREAMKWLSAWSRNGDNVSGEWTIGRERIGNQIDMRPNPSQVAKDSDRAIDLNRGYKKKETQRQKEKRMKDSNAKEAPASKTSELKSDAAPAKFQFDGMSAAWDAAESDRLGAVMGAFKSLSLEEKVRTVSHPISATVEEMLKHLQSESGGKCKNLFLKYSKKKSRTIENDTGIWLVSAMHDTVIDTKKLSKSLGYPKTLRMGRPDLLKESLGLVKGECSPFALINDPKRTVQVILDAAMMKEKSLWFHPLTNKASTSISPADLLTFIRASGREPRIVDFAAL